MDPTLATVIGYNTAILGSIIALWREMSKMCGRLGVLEGQVIEQSKRLNHHDEEIRKW